MIFSIDIINMLNMNYKININTVMSSIIKVLLVLHTTIYTIFVILGQKDIKNINLVKHRNYRTGFN